MDAKPQRPRTLRVRDENVMPALLHPGKTLHHRTKSTPSIALLASMDARQSKPVLGVRDKNKPVRGAVKDDLAIGLTSPDKIKTEKIMSAIANTFIPRTHALPPLPLTRPVAAAPTQAPVLRDVSKVSQLSTKVDKVNDALTSGMKPAEPATEGVKNVASAPSAVQHQQTRTTEVIPLRDEPKPSALLAAPVDFGVAFKENIDPQLTGGVPLATNVSALSIQPSVIAMEPSLQPEDPIVSGPVVSIPYADVAFSTPELAQSSPDVEEDYTAARSWGVATDNTLTTLFDPKYNEKINYEIAAAKAFVDETRTAADIEDDFLDTSMVAEYNDDIFDYFRELEVSMKPDPFYMVRQVELGWSMRAVLVDWIVQVHARFNLLPETLFLTVNYIDRFLTEKVVSIGKLQLVGATAIFLAAKYEEVNCPTLSEIVYMVENAYSGDEILKAERFMLTQLGFRLGWPGPMSFLRRISKADDYDLETRTLAKYFLEVCIMDERFLGLTPSFLAAGAHCMARFMLRKGEWTQAHVYYSNYTFGQLKSLLRGIVECLEVPRRHHEAVYVKYSDRRFKRASTYVENEMTNGFRLPFMRAY